LRSTSSSPGCTVTEGEVRMKMAELLAIAREQVKAGQ
jgi:hypothetical protein